MSNKKIYKNRLSLPIFDNKGIGNGNGIAYIPNVIRGGSAIPIGNNMFLMRGRSHAQGGIDIGRDLEVEGNEVVQNGKFGTKVFSSVPFLRGVSPAERVLRGENPDTVFAAQEVWKRVHKVADDGSRKASKGKYVTNPVLNKVNSSKANFVSRLKNPNRKYIKDWESNNITTHKLSVGTDEYGNNYIYPEVQEINGKLVDFTNPIYNEWEGRISAEQRGDTVRIKNLDDAVKFTKDYKKYYPNFDYDETAIRKTKQIGGRIKSALGLSLFRPNSFKVRRVPINDFITPTLGEIEEPETPAYTLTDDEKPAAKAQEYAKVAEALKAYPYGNKSSKTTSAIDNTLFDDIKGERGFNKSEMRTIYKYLNDNGSNLSDYAKSAILATIAFESGANIRARNPRSSAKGYFQWLDDRYKFANNLSDEEERKLQLQKIINDMNPTDAFVNKAKDARGWTSVGGRGYLKTAEDFRKAQDTLTAVNLITRGHIRPGNQDWEVAHRKMLADMFYNAIAKSKSKKAFGGEDKVYTAPKWAQDSYKKYGKVIIGGTPVINPYLQGSAFALMRNPLLRTLTRDAKNLYSALGTGIQKVFVNGANRVGKLIPNKYLGSYDKLINNIYSTFIGDASKDILKETRKGWKYYPNLERLPATINNTVDTVNNIVNEKQFGGMKLNIFKLGGLSRSKDYGSKDKPYPSVNKNDFAGGGRSYPIPTRADAVDALRLAGLHHRSDVRAKVYAKYPDLRKKAAMGTIDEEDLQDLLYQQRMNSKQTNNTSKTVRNNYVEKTNNDLATNIGKGIIGSLIGGSGIFGLNKVAKNYRPSLTKNNKFVSPNYDVVENPTDLERKYNYPKRVANRIKNSGVEELWDNRRLENATKRVNAILDKYGDKIKIVNEPVAKEISSTQVYDVAKPKKYTPNLSEFSPEIKAGVQKVNKQNLNLARRLGTNIRNIGGILGKALPGFALIDVVRNLFPSKQQEQEADKAWRRYKSPTGRISEDYQMKFGGRKKAPFGDYITIGGRRVPLVFDTNNRISDQVLSLMYPAEETSTERLPIDFNRLSLLNTTGLGTNANLANYLASQRLNSNGSNFPIDLNRYSLLNTNNIGTRGSSPYGLPSRLNSNGSYFPINFDRLGRANVNPTYVFNDVLGYTGNINGQRVLLNPSYIRQVPKSVRQAVLNNTPEIVRGASSIRRNVDDNNALSNAKPQYYAEENRNMYPELNNNFGLFRYGWSHNGNNRTISPAESLDAVNRIAGYDLSTYFNNNNNSRTPRRTQPVRVRTERVGNVPETYREFRRPNLTQLETRGIGLNMPAYTSPFTPTTTSGTRTYNIGVPTTLDTSRLDSTLSRYGVTPISSSTGVQPNPADVEAVRSGNFKAIDNDRYLPIRATTEDWIGLGANLLGSIGSYLGTRAMLNSYPMPNKPVPTIAQKLKTRVNINPQLDTLREQADKLKTSIDNNTSSSRVAQARKQGVMNNAVASRNQLYGQKENAETQLINQDIMNRQRIGLYNNQIFNDYLGRLGSTRQYVASGKINNINNLINGTNQSIQDLLGRIDDRDANLRDFIFMEAAYPNVNWRNIFGNPELARSLGFRFV